MPIKMHFAVDNTSTMVNKSKILIAIYCDQLLELTDMSIFKNCLRIVWWLKWPVCFTLSRLLSCQRVYWPSPALWLVSGLWSPSTLQTITGASLHRGEIETRTFLSWHLMTMHCTVWKNYSYSYSYIVILIVVFSTISNPSYLGPFLHYAQMTVKKHFQQLNWLCLDPFINRKEGDLTILQASSGKDISTTK